MNLGSCGMGRAKRVVEYCDNDEGVIPNIPLPA
jgi:hypothetical protein